MKQGVPLAAEDALVVLHTLLDEIKTNPDGYGLLLAGFGACQVYGVYDAVAMAFSSII